jgi:putative protease
MKSSTSEIRITLPLVAAEGKDVIWEGWRPLGTLPDPTESPIPLEPQGEYAPGPAEIPFPQPMDFGQPRRVELMAPAGGPQAAYAAFHFGADAIYLGLKKFSARAEAENFTIAELDEVTAYAHSLRPRRHVFVTINTLIRQNELPELVEALAHLADISVDAVILQDLGVYHLARRYFPELELHASTQLAVHNRVGAEVLGQMGFTRVVLARELTFEEVRDITATSGIETEVFIHGALCYSYSGLCLFSSQSLGRSGNRGKCAYSCRDDFQVSGAPLELRDGSSTKRDPRHGFPFSMKDLALPDHIPALRAAGVSCFKVEGRKKSPLYVASTTDYYRRLMDGKLAPGERPTVEADLQTVFSRPWTRLFLDSHKDKEVADRDTVGHRGSKIGQVEAVVRAGSGDYRLRFKTMRSLERHDGLQIDLPTQGRPFGFAIERLWLDKKREVFEAPALSLVEVSLPAEHPTIPVGAPVYCSSSQSVKQHYRFDQPKAGQYRTRKAFSVEVNLTLAELCVTGRIGETTAIRRLPGPFSPAREPAAIEKALQGAFARFGSTRLVLENLTISNDAGLFVPVSRLNQIRRDLVADLEKALNHRLETRINEIQDQVGPVCPTGPERAKSRSASGTYLKQFRWSIKVDRIAFLDALQDGDLADVDEIIIDIARDRPAILLEKVNSLAERIGPERIRLALPALTRSWEDKGIRHKIEQLREAGWRKWEVANLSGWQYLGVVPKSPGAHAPGSPDIDFATDWSIYVLNRLAGQQLLDMGVSRFTLSPEDGLAN